MSHQHDINKVKRFDGHDLKKYCSHDRRTMEMREKGDHVIVQGPTGTVVFPDRPMGDGLWCKVIKGIISIGLGMIACGAIEWVAHLLKATP